MFVARYTTKSLKLYAGYEYIRYEPPSNPQAAFTDIAGNFLCQGCDAFNGTNINNAAFGVNGLGNKTFQVMWAGMKYSVNDDLDVIAAYYHYIQNSFFGTAAGGASFCSSSAHAQCAGTFDAISAAVDWRFAPKWDTYFGVMFTQVNGGLASGFFQHSNVAPTAGLRFRF
jgi:hypothetical protein